MPRQAAQLQGYPHRIALDRGGRICQILFTVNGRNENRYIDCSLTYRAVYEEEKDVITSELVLLGGSPVRCMMKIFEYMLLNLVIETWEHIVAAHGVQLAVR